MKIKSDEDLQKMLEGGQEPYIHLALIHRSVLAAEQVARAADRQTAALERIADAIAGCPERDGLLDAVHAISLNTRTM